MNILLKLKAFGWQSLQTVRLRYTLAIFSVLVVAVIGVKLFRLENPMWLLISCVISTDVDQQQLKQIIFNRTMATITGIVVAIASLLILGPGCLSFFIGVLFLVLLCHSIPFLLTGWRLTVVTAVIVLVGGLEEKSSLAIAEHTAMMRAVEVLAGCLIAGMVSLLLNKVWLRVDKYAKLAAMVNEAP